MQKGEGSRRKPVKLPAWMSQKDALEGLEEYRAMTPDERAEVLVSVCDLATALLNARPDQDRLDWILNLEDPMPESSRQHFARLRRGPR